MKVGFIGTGDMGLRMARNVMKQHDLFVHNRTPSKADPLVGEGATWVDDPLVMDVDVLILMLTGDDACRHVIAGDKGLVAMSARPVVVNMSTVTPQLSTEMGDLLAGEGFSYLEAPVSGTLPHAEQASLIILAGGESDVLELVRPVLDLMGSPVHYLGKLGNAARSKLLINSTLAVHTAMLAEYLTLSQKMGLDPEAMLDIIDNSALGNVVSKAKGPNMLKGEHPTLFRYRYLIKDLTYALQAAEPADAPLTQKVLDLYRQGGEELGELDFSAISKAYGLDT